MGIQTRCFGPRASPFSGGTRGSVQSFLDKSAPALELKNLYTRMIWVKETTMKNLLKRK